MYFEKWGFMLIFWNLAGVPLSYCHCTLYIANHDPAEYHWNPYLLTLLFLSYLFVYWIWDTANSQKNMFRAQERGVEIHRKTFPQLPYKAVKNPVSIKTATGDSILCDGWCKSSILTSLSPLQNSIFLLFLLLPLGNKTNRSLNNRWQSPQNPLHLRPLLRSFLGRNHRLQLTLPMVLPFVFRLYDCA
jgi:hypothetical protein